MTSPGLAVHKPISRLWTTDSPLENFLRVSLIAVALIYAFLAGLRTVQDFDLGWQLATGRWVIQHHHVPSVDVLSYTAQGEPWIYPVGAGIIFYWAFLLGSYALISWIGAAACCGTVALALRRGSVVSAAIAILAVPVIAFRTAPRADMFTVVLFTAFLSLLWQNYQTGDARLWILPLLMLAWVNLHFGFVAGLGLVLAYIGVEFSEVIFGEARRQAAIQRLRRAWLWLLCTFVVTLANPWGWGIYRALLRQQRANTEQQVWITEWSAVPLNWAVISSSLSLRQTRGAIYMLLAIGVIAAAIALLRRQLGAAILLLAATYPAVRHVRMTSIFSCVVIIVAGPVLYSAIQDARLRSSRIRSLAFAAVTVALMALALVRCVDLASNRHYFSSTDEATFGAGLGWWFPQRAAEFVERNNLPSEIFNTYNEGGYLTWRLGPQRKVYIDGRDTLYGVPRIQHEETLRENPPDSLVWDQEVSRYNINTVILSLARYDGIQVIQLQPFCESKKWRPVYMDEISAVFVRRTPATESLIQRFPLDCATAPLPAIPPGSNRAQAFNSWTNAASVLAVLGRNSEALAANANALAIFPDSAYLHWNRAEVLFAMGQLSDAEQEYLAAVALEPSAATWGALASSYQKRGRLPAAAAALKQAAQFSIRPYSTLLNVGYLELKSGQPGAALKTFDEAARSAPKDISTADNGDFEFMLAQGRSGAWEALGDLEKAVLYQEQVAHIPPEAAPQWLRLAKLYELQGRRDDAKLAREHAAELQRNQAH